MNTRINLRKPEGTNFNKISSFIHDAMEQYFEKPMFFMKKHQIFGRKNFNADICFLETC
jgi:hypothetical protein